MQMAIPWDTQGVWIECERSQRTCTGGTHTNHVFTPSGEMTLRDYQHSELQRIQMMGSSFSRCIVYDFVCYLHVPLQAQPTFGTFGYHISVGGVGSGSKKWKPAMDPGREGAQKMCSIICSNIEAIAAIRNLVEGGCGSLI